MQKLYLSIFLLSTNLFAHTPFVKFPSTDDEAGYFKFSKNTSIVYFKENKIVYNIFDSDILHSETNDQKIYNAHCVSMNLLNGNQVNPIPFSKEITSKYNYFLGKNKNDWIIGASAFDTIIYPNVFDGVDLLYYESNHNLKYEYIVNENVNCNQIRIKIEGANNVSIINNELHIKTNLGTIIEKKPFAFQFVDGAQTKIECSFSLEQNILSFKLGNYDPKNKLIIDPSVIFSTYSSTSALLSADGTTYDSQGNMYIAAGTISLNYQGTPGAFQVSIGTGAGWNMVVEKYSANGNNLLYSTLLGGVTGQNSIPLAEDYPYSLFCDTNDDLYILGTSNSTDYPIINGAYQSSIAGGTDYVISKLSASGNSLINSTYFGGLQDEGGAFQQKVSSIYIYNNEIYITGLTQSTNLPVTAGCAQNTNNGMEDGIVAKFNSNLSNVLFSTYLGGAGNDDVCDIKVSANGEIYLCGNTSSNNFPSTSGGLNPNAFGNQDGFVCKLNSSGAMIIQSSYLGTASSDKAKFIQIDLNNDIYILGATKNSNYPVTNGAYNYPGTYNYFIHKLNSAVTSTIFSTCIGGLDNSGANLNEFVPTAFGVDPCLNLHFSGSNLNGGLPITTNAIQNNSKSVYLCSIDKNGASLLFGSYYGGAISGNNSGSHIHESTNNRFNPAGILFHTECTLDNNYALLNQVSTDNNGNSNNAASFKLDFSFVTRSFSSIIPNDSIHNPSCGSNNGSIAVNVSGGSGNYSYNWLPTGGNNSSAYNLSAGTYSVIVTDLNPDCGIASDTLTATLITSMNAPDISVNATTTSPGCNSNNGTILLNASGGSGTYNYVWSPSVSNGTTASNLSNGSYTVVVSDVNVACPGKADTILITLNSSGITGIISYTNPVCSYGNDGSIHVQLTGTTGNVIYVWNNGASGSYQDSLDSGSYSVTATDSLGCTFNGFVNLISNSTQPSINIVTNNATTTQLGSANLIYQNLQLPAVFNWQTSPPQYGTTATNISPGEYYLNITDAYGCQYAYPFIIEGQLNIPNIVTNNHDGVNENFQINYLPPESKIRIYNRWGNLVYTSNDYKNEWPEEKINDGTYFYILQLKSGKNYNGYIQVLK